MAEHGHDQVGAQREVAIERSAAAAGPFRDFARRRIDAQFREDLLCRLEQAVDIPARFRANAPLGSGLFRVLSRIRLHVARQLATNAMIVLVGSRDFATGQAAEREVGENALRFNSMSRTRPRSTPRRNASAPNSDVWTCSSTMRRSRIRTGS